MKPLIRLPCDGKSLPGLAASRPKGVCESLDLSPGARECAAADPSPQEFLRVLLLRRHHRDALHYLAHALPRREAVRWACDCVLAARAGMLSTAALHAVQVALAWADAPGRATCAAASQAAEAATRDEDAAARFAALAAAWSGDSLAPEDLPCVPPPEAIGAGATVAAVLIAALGTALPADEQQRSFISRGILAARSR